MSASLRRSGARHVLGALASGLALAAVGFGVPSASAAGLPRLHFGVRLVNVPVDEANNPRALQYIIDFLPVGTVIRRKIMIINYESRTTRFSVYPGAARISGGLFTGDAGRTANELTRWITVRRPTVTVGPGQSALDLVTIRVPPGATRAEHYGVIWAQQTATIRTSTQVVIRDVARVGVRVYLAVGRGGAPPTRFIITSLAGQRSASGRPLLVAGVRDTGGRAVDLIGRARLRNGPAHSSSGPYAGKQMVTLAPGQSGKVLFTLPADLPAGRWTTSVTLVSGLTRATARTTVSFGALATTSASRADPAMLAGGSGLLAVLLVVAAMIIIRVRRMRQSLA